MPIPEQSWLLLAVGTGRQHGGNDGYSEDPRSNYRWDSTVPNRDGPAVGHAVVLWDKRVSLGMSVIEDVERGSAPKRFHRCPRCERASIKERSTRMPLFKCFTCGLEFDQPLTAVRQVTTYVASYEAAWTGLSGDLSAAQLRGTAVSPASQLSIRPLDWARFLAVLRSVSPALTAPSVALAVDQIRGGHTLAIVRARIGQGVFRKRLLERHGPVCAFTGPNPVEVLEAAHLYQYAGSGRHEAGGGLLLRRDVHALFDAGHLTVGEDDRIRVDDGLAAHPVYGGLARREVQVPLSAAERGWLTLHRSQAVNAVIDDPAVG